MKLPSLPRRKPKAAKATAKSKAVKSQLRAPRPVEDLYRDMRDRRLLLPALGLIVAIIAVPIALKSPKEDPPVPAAFVEPEGAEAVSPAVLAEDAVGVRDYRKRLDALKSKNPFAGSFPEPAALAGDGALVDPATESTSAPAAGNAPTDPATTSPADVSTIPADGSSFDGSTAGEILILAPRVDVKTGRFGEPKDLEGVELGDLLPDRRKAPVVMLIGVSEDLKHATFLVSDDVSETDGDGSCRPRANDCEFLRLADGEKRTFVYEPNGRKYVVKVTDIREVVVDRRKVKAG
jgi:hypothetical protein